MSEPSSAQKEVEEQMHNPPPAPVADDEPEEEQTDEGDNAEVDPRLRQLERPTPGQPRTIRARTGLTHDPVPHGKKVAVPRYRGLPCVECAWACMVAILW